MGQGRKVVEKSWYEEGFFTHDWIKNYAEEKQLSTVSVRGF